jgi:8-oxo-dGTP pyrophosphatase MutT (NUDIX family)
VAVGLIVDGGGRLLLQLRDAKPGIVNPDRWAFFGGHLERGERPAEAFLREMQEELGWRPRQFEHFTTREVDRDGWHVTSHVFAAHLDVPLDALTLMEGQRMELFAPDALPDGIVPANMPVIEEFVESDAYRRARRAWDLRTATALLVDRDGRFLLQHRDDKPGIANPGRWGSFGGEIEPYEAPDDGFLRELGEELAWQPSAYALFGAYPFRMDGGMALIYVYTALVDVPPETLVLGEGQGMGFFAPDDLPEATVADLRALIERFVADEAYRRLVGE